MRPIILAGMAVLLATPSFAANTQQLCISNRAIKATRFSAKGYFVKIGPNWYQNTANSCPLFAPDRAVRVQSITNRQCKGDQVEIFQTVTALGFGSCTLGPWHAVPPETVPTDSVPKD